MSDLSDRDLAAAFEELHAPASTAGYAARTPSFDVPSSTRSRSWPQALAAVLTVAVALAGAGTFLALRSARQGAGPAVSGANPPARYGGAMAYDSSTGVTVLYGGTDGAGKQLTDTWTWNGSAWTAAAKGPGPLVDVRMVDDPAGSGVLLVGLPAPKVTGGGAVGCVSGGTGVASPGSVAGGTPAGSNTGSAAGTPGSSLATPPAGVPVTTASPSGAALPTCPPVPPPPTEQTWLFSSQGWTLASSGSAATTPVVGAQLTFDPTTRQVVAVSSSFFSCGPPLEVAGGPAIACPALGTSSKVGASAALGVPCNAAGDCPAYGTTSTWTWSGRSWQRASSATLQAGGLILLFTDPTTGHATLMSQDAGSSFCPHPLSGAAIACPMPATPSPAAQTTTWSWTGSGWRQVSRVPDTQRLPSVAGASVAAVDGHIVVVTTDGQTWTFAAGQWTQGVGVDQPSTRSGAAMAEGPSGTVVLFGGTVGGGFVEPLSGTSSASSASSAATGSDTWVWNGSAWKHVAGAEPSPPPAPTACPGVVSLQPKCVGPPTRVLPTVPAGTTLPEGGGTPIP